MHMINKIIHVCMVSGLRFRFQILLSNYHANEIKSAPETAAISELGLKAERSMRHGKEMPMMLMV